MSSSLLESSIGNVRSPVYLGRNEKNAPLTVRPSGAREVVLRSSAVAVTPSSISVELAKLGSLYHFHLLVTSPTHRTGKTVRVCLEIADESPLCFGSIQSISRQVARLEVVIVPVSAGHIDTFLTISCEEEEARISVSALVVDQYDFERLHALRSASDVYLHGKTLGRQMVSVCGSRRLENSRKKVTLCFSPFGDVTEDGVELKRYVERTEGGTQGLDVIHMEMNGLKVPQSVENDEEDEILFDDDDDETWEGENDAEDVKDDVEGEEWEESLRRSEKEHAETVGAMFGVSDANVVRESLEEIAEELRKS